MFDPTPLPTPDVTIFTILQLATSHSWLLLAIAAVVFVRHLLSDRSKFPVTIPPTWLPTVSAFFGLAFTVLVAKQAGASWAVALLGGFTMAAASGFFDGLAVGIFGGDPTRVPAWARWILMLVDGIGTGGTPSKSGDAVTREANKLTPPTSLRDLDPDRVARLTRDAWRKAPPLRLLGATLVCLCAGLLLTGCLSSAPIVPVTPANQAQIQTCQNTATLHNGFVIGDFALGGIASGLASASAAVGDQQTKTNLAIAGASVGGALVLGTAIAELTGSNFQNSQCANVVGQLPTSAAPASSGH